jgi:hypothetical protein
MTVSARSILTAGITTITATAIVVAPSVAPPPPSAPPTVELAAQTRPLVQKPFAALVAAAVQQQSQTANVAAPLVDQQATAALLAFPGISQAIKDIYNFAEYWVDYGVDVAEYFVNWIPFGYLISPQIDIIYQSIERVVRSITFNIADFIGGSVSFVQGVRNVIRDSINAGIYFLNREISYGFGFLPPLPFGPPQIPYVPWFNLQQASALDVTAKEAVDTEPGDNAAPKGPKGAIAKVLGDLTKGLIPAKTLPVTVEDEVAGQVEEVIPKGQVALEDEADGTSGVDKDVVADTAPVRPTRPLLTASRTLTKGLVRAQGEIRGAIAEVSKGVTDAAESNDRGAVREAPAATPKTVAAGLRDSGRRIERSIQKVVGGLKKAADDARAARTERKAEAAAGE